MCAALPPNVTCTTCTRLNIHSAQGALHRHHARADTRLTSLVRAIDRTRGARRSTEVDAAARRAELEQSKWADAVIAQQARAEREAALRDAAQARLAAAAAPPSELSALKQFVLTFTCDRAVLAMNAARENNLDAKNPKFKLAKHHYDTALRIYELKQKQEIKEVGADNPVCEQTAFDHAGWLEKGGRYEEAEEEIRSVFNTRRKLLGRDHIAVADAALRLCENLLLHGEERQDEAMFLGEKAVMYFAARKKRNLRRASSPTSSVGAAGGGSSDDDADGGGSVDGDVLAEDETKLLHALSVVAQAYGAAGESGAEAKAYQMICGLKLSLQPPEGGESGGGGSFGGGR